MRKASTTKNAATRRRPAAESDAREDGAQLARVAGATQARLQALADQLEAAEAHQLEALNRMAAQLEAATRRHAEAYDAMEKRHQALIDVGAAHLEQMQRDTKDHTARMIAEARAEIGEQVVALVNTAKESLK